MRSSNQKDGALDGMVTPFRKSSFCDGGACVMVATRSDGSVLVRDGKATNDQMLRFTRKEWSAFVKGVKASEFDAE